MDKAHFKVPLPIDHYWQAVKGRHPGNDHLQPHTGNLNSRTNNTRSRAPASRKCGYPVFRLQPSRASACFVRHTPAGQRSPAPVAPRTLASRTLATHPAHPRLPPAPANKTDLQAPAQIGAVHHQKAGDRQSVFTVQSVCQQVIPYSDRHIPDQRLRAEVHRDFLAMEDWILNPWVKDQLLLDVSRAGERWKHDDTLVNWAAEGTLWAKLDGDPVDPLFMLRIKIKSRNASRSNDPSDEALAQRQKFLQLLKQYQTENPGQFGKDLKLTPLVGKELRKLSKSDRLERLLPRAILQGYTRTAQWCLENGANIKTALTMVRQLKARSAAQQSDSTAQCQRTAPSINKQEQGIDSFSNDINATLLEVIADAHIDMTIQAEWLLANGASLSSDESATQLNQALNTSLNCGYLANARWLIDKGASLQVQEQFKKAMSHRNTRVAQWLIDNHQAKQNPGNVRENPEQDRQYMIDFLKRQGARQGTSDCDEPPKKKITQEA